MRKNLFYFIFLLVVPSLIYPAHIPYLESSTCSKHEEKVSLKLDASLTYDEMLYLLEQLESGCLEKHCSFEELEKIDQFLAFLAKEGVLPNDLEGEIALEEDIEDLLHETLFEAAFFPHSDQRYQMIPTVFYGDLTYEIMYCGWLKKKWKKTKKFVKKHKKALIIGAVVVVAVTAVTMAVVVSSASIASAAGASAGAASAGLRETSSKSTSSHASPSRLHENASNGNASLSSNVPPSHETPLLTSALEDQISSFKDNIAEKDLLTSSMSDDHSLPLEETGRILGPLFAHETLNLLNASFSDSPELAHEIQTIRKQITLDPVMPQTDQQGVDFGHLEIERKFSNSPLFLNPEKDMHFNALFYQMRGEKALDFGYLTQAIDDLDKAIEMNPTNSISYLNRSEAHFKLGNYDKCLEDFHIYTQQAAQKPKKCPMNTCDFSMGFLKGLPKGILESGHNILLLCSNIVLSPIQTGKQMWESLKLLSDLARSNEWSIFAEVLVPEVHQLITQWDTLHSNVRGELAGHSFGKYGADIIIPGALAKAAAKGMRGARELSAISKNFKTAKRTFLMESVTGMGSGAKIEKIVQLEKRISNWLGKETRFIKNKAGDSVFLSKDGLRRIRFDFNRTKPHNNLHAHIEVKVSGKWVKSGPIYPIDVPHN